MKIEFEIGDKVRSTRHVEFEGILIPPAFYTIRNVLKDGKNIITHIGIMSDIALMDWGDLGGQCNDGYGLWVPTGFFMRHFVSPDFGNKMQIGGEFIFKKRDLNGKNCRLLSKLPNSKIAFVELDEHVDGCSADGLGKAGYCIMVPTKILKKVK
jgi:hypothetical protein